MKRAIEGFSIAAVLILAGGLIAAQTAESVSSSVLQGHRAGLTSVQFSPDGDWLASSSLDGTVRLWSTRTWKTERNLNHGAEVYAIAFSRDGKLLASGGYDARIVLWSVASGKQVRAVKLSDWISGLSFTPAGDLVAGSNDHTVRVIRPQDGAILRTIDTKQEVLSLAVSTDGRYLATAIPVKIWNLTTGEALTKEVRAFGNNGLAFSPNGQFLATAEPVGGARILSVPTGERRQSLNITQQKKMKGPQGYVQELFNMPASAVAFSADGMWLATGGTEFGLQLWRLVDESNSTTLTANTPTRVLTGHSMTVTGVSFSPDGKYLATASLDRTVRVWPLR